MGLLLKFILFAILIGYVIRVVGRFFFGITGANQHDRVRRDGNVHVDSDPSKGKKGFDGGEYVDYEEVK